MAPNLFKPGALSFSDQHPRLLVIGFHLTIPLHSNFATYSSHQTIYLVVIERDSTHKFNNLTTSLSHYNPLSSQTSDAFTLPIPVFWSHRDLQCLDPSIYLILYIGHSLSSVPFNSPEIPCAITSTNLLKISTNVSSFNFPSQLCIFLQFFVRYLKSFLYS